MVTGAILGHDRPLIRRMHHPYVGLNPLCIKKSKVTIPIPGSVAMSHASKGSKRRTERSRDELVVRTKGLVKLFGTLRAVDGLDLRIRRGELYGLLGPNGSGKTTTIKMMMGLLRINGGWAEVLGRRVPDKGLMRDIGYMPQETAIYRELSVHDNLVLFGEIHDMPRSDIYKREAELLDLVELQDWRKVLVGNLSGGMMHRLSLACSLMHDPEIMFLDEPTVGVDPELRDTLWKHFKDLSRLGKTIVITTHYIEEARNCDLCGLMRRGTLIAEDPPRRLMERAGTETLEEAFLHFTRRSERRKAFRNRKALAKDMGGDEE
jgi:ABC-2 type transport system ATP-binding protein